MPYALGLRPFGVQGWFNILVVVLVMWCVCYILNGWMDGWCRPCQYNTIHEMMFIGWCCGGSGGGGGDVAAAAAAFQ